MKVIYARQPLTPFAEVFPSVFLAGPTHRHKGVKGWRPDMLQIIEEYTRKEHDQWTVFVPEDEGGGLAPCDHTTQVEWEHEALDRATYILFWVPRNMSYLPGLTTNIEFGYWMSKDPRKCVLGYPPHAQSCKYLGWLYAKRAGRHRRESMRATWEQVEKLYRRDW